jgi:hypothetical protein
MEKLNLQESSDDLDFAARGFWREGKRRSLHLSMVADSRSRFKRRGILIGILLLISITDNSTAV